MQRRCAAVVRRSPVLCHVHVSVVGGLDAAADNFSRAEPTQSLLEVVCSLGVLPQPVVQLALFLARQHL